MKRLSESTARQTIAMMRSIASHKPITPFHLMAADEMEKLLEEVLQYRALIDAETLSSDHKGLKLRSKK